MESAISLPPRQTPSAAAWEAWREGLKILTNSRRGELRLPANLALGPFLVSPESFPKRTRHFWRFHVCVKEEDVRIPNITELFVTSVVKVPKGVTKEDTNNNMPQQNPSPLRVVGARVVGARAVGARVRG